MKIDKQAVGRRIKEIRLSVGQTMEQFGKNFGVSKGVVNNWEKGRNLPNKPTLLSLSYLADMDVNELLYSDYICPRCENSDIRRDYKFCQVCGLKIERAGNEQ
ncbi:helix-turn-helix domain-containing protein [Aerococcaceae bacterium NML190073]|nr:helix-turn-helix domain-containing protein [Aerococcaceae bacterium NML190073]